MSEHDIKLATEGSIDLPTSGAEGVLTSALVRAVELDAHIAIVCLVTPPQLYVLTSNGLTHKDLAELFTAMGHSHAERAKLQEIEETNESRH